VITCHICSRPATCVAYFSDTVELGAACDVCCTHEGEAECKPLFSDSQIIALRDILLSHITAPGHTEVFIDVITGEETTPEELLKVLMR
jgi:hypothetical protein